MPYSDNAPAGPSRLRTGLLTLALTMTSSALADAPPTAEGIAFFEQHIRPVLVEHCYRCHSADAKRLRGEFRLDSRAAMQAGGETGPGIVPGRPDLSLVITALRYEDDFEMPPKGKLSDQIIADFETWIRMGAPDPRTEESADQTAPEEPADARAFWSFAPVADPAPPVVEDTAWPRDDIDRFLLAELEQRGLEPVNDADQATLIRRLTFDLTGLPPTPEAVRAFTRDRSADAIERLVDDLLESPAFGERWGRHWLDVARYAESSGKDSNIFYPHAWRYRDWVIRAFNADKPYDTFLKEQIAGDLLPAADEHERADLIIATGYLALGSKGHNTANRNQFTADVIDEQIDAFSQGMLGITIACARCHDHKFDPISTRDYYALAGIFLSSENCFGTTRAGGNRHTAPLIPLSPTSGVSPGPEMPAALRDTIIQRQGRAEQQVRTLQDDVEQNGRRNNPSAQRLRIIRGQLNTINAVLERYDEVGHPRTDQLRAMGVREADRMRDAPILHRGELDQIGETVPRGFPVVLTDEMTPTIVTGSGRLELADWIASPSNPLTARVWVNRVWLHLFGAPITLTTDNFGASGVPPTHPELLDHLAGQFMDDGWSTKQLVRRLVLTRAYQLSSRHNRANYKVDPENIYRWRMSPRRLEAEAIRDAMLSAAGTLQREPPAGSTIALLEGSTRALDRFQGADLEPPVRSVYLPVLRDRLPEALDVFDFAEPNFVSGDRDETNVPTQALYLLNNERVMAEAQAMADRLLAMDLSDHDRVRYAFELAFGRTPSRTEVSATERFFRAFPDAQANGAPGAPSTDRRTRNARSRGRTPRRDAAPDPRRLGWATFCQSLFAAAEFRFLN